jgi:hypothetical protein
MIVLILAWLLQLIGCLTTSLASIPPTQQPTNYPSMSPNSLFIVTTIAGTGSATYSGDNGQATAATFNYPYQLVLDASGTLAYVTQRCDCL